MWIIVWNSDKGKGIVDIKGKEATFFVAKIEKDWNMQRDRLRDAEKC
jgi:hypothetical protein